MGAEWRAGKNLVQDNRFGTLGYEQWLSQRVESDLTESDLTG
jgi:hypothetical protein